MVAFGGGLLRGRREGAEAAMASGGGAVREVGSKAELDAAVGGARAAAVHFWAAWCEASKQMDEVFAYAVDFPHALFLRGEANLNTFRGIWAITQLLTKTEGLVVPVVPSTHGVSAFAYLPEGPAKSVANISVLCATEMDF